MKRAMYLFCGICWLAFGLAAAVFTCRHLFDDGGTQSSGFLFFVPMFIANVLIGLAQFAGLATLTVLCFVIGIGLLSNGVEPTQGSEQKPEPPKR